MNALWRVSGLADEYRIREDDSTLAKAWRTMFLTAQRFSFVGM